MCAIANRRRLRRLTLRFVALIALAIAAIAAHAGSASANYAVQQCDPGLGRRSTVQRIRPFACRGQDRAGERLAVGCGPTERGERSEQQRHLGRLAVQRSPRTPSSRAPRARSTTTQPAVTGR